MAPEDLVVRHTLDAAAFLDRAGGFLRRRPVEHSVLLTVAASYASGSSPGPSTGASPGLSPEGGLWLWVEDRSGAVVAAAQHTPPYAPYLSTGPDAAMRALARHLRDLRPDLSGVGGLRPAAEAFADEWRRLGGGAATVLMAQGMYRADSVTAPEGVPGRMRSAVPEEASMLEAWAVDGFPTEQEHGAIVRRRLASGGLVVWDVDGEVAAMAGATEPQGGVVRVQLVYTPPQRRRRGYAGALVAALTARELAYPGRTCMLYTDLDNPTSNHVYQQVGYRRVAEAVQLRFGGRGS